MNVPRIRIFKVQAAAGTGISFQRLDINVLKCTTERLPDGKSNEGLRIKCIKHF